MSGVFGQCVSLERCLKTTNAPLDEIQAWSLCYQLLKYSGFLDLCGTSLPTSRYLQTEKLPSVDNVFIYVNGEVRCGNESGTGSRFTEAEMNTWLNRLGGVLYRCLDFGLAEGEERELGEAVCDLIEALTAPAPERDEGIEGDEESQVGDVVARVRQMCEAVSEGCGQRPGPHHAAVCRAMFWHVRELHDFLDGVQEVEASSEEERRLRKLDVQVWASLWSQVMEDLRRGVRLRAVKNAEQLPSQQRLFELTPYEMLLEDIRLRRYKLRRIEQTPVPGHLRASAHEMILEYIRSRPPLRPVSRRVLARAPSCSQTPRDRTLEAIRGGEFKLRVVKRPVENRCALPRRRRRRRLIKPDFHLDELSDEDEAFPQLWDLMVGASSFSPSSTSLGTPAPSVEDLRSSVRRRIRPLATPEIADLRRRASCASDGDLRRNTGPPGLRERRRDSHCGTMSCQTRRRGLGLAGIMQESVSDADLSDASLPASPPVARRQRHSLAARTEAEVAAPRRCSLDAKLSSGGLSRRGPRPPHTALRDSGLSCSARSSLYEAGPDSDADAVDGDLGRSTRSTLPLRAAALSPASSSSYSSYDDVHAGEADLGVAASPLRRQNAGRRSVRLSLTEVALIRSTLARAELESYARDKKLYEKMRRERICFSCRKTEFGLLRWGKRCNLCQKLVCADCRTKANLPSNRTAPLGDFLVNSLAPAEDAAAVVDGLPLQTSPDAPKSGLSALRRHQSFIGADAAGRSESAVVCRRCACIGYMTGAGADPLQSSPSRT